MDYPVRGASAELGRADIADLCIGKMLANASVGKDRIWQNTDRNAIRSNGLDLGIESGYQQRAMAGVGDGQDLAAHIDHGQLDGDKHIDGRKFCEHEPVDTRQQIARMLRPFCGGANQGAERGGE